MKIEVAEKIAKAWPEATSLQDAMAKAGVKGKDVRTLNRVRREAEKILGITLETINPQFSTETDIDCPTLLNISKARKAKDLIITSCTNDSPLVPKFFKALKLFTESRKGQLAIIPIRYKNVSALNSGDGHKWDEEIYPYALKQSLILNKNLVVSAARIHATAVNPLSGMASLHGIRSVVYGHPQLAMEMVATPSEETPKMMHTTGSVSRPRYSSSKAGDKANFNHSLSALYVQISGATFYPIQLSWDGNGFYYLNEYWTEDGKEDGEAEALHIGDTHAFWEREDITKLRNNLLDVIKPKKLIWNDIHDHHSQSHHHTTIERIRIANEGNHLVEDELELSAATLNSVGKGYDNLIVQSNHDKHLDQWLNRFDARFDPHNASYYFYLMGKVVQSGKTALECAISHKLNVEHRFINSGDKVLVAGINVSHHGDVGANGSRGSAVGFAKSAHKINIGHSHTPRIEKGCWQAGTSTDKMFYAIGLSSWVICDIIIYKNSKRAMIFYIKGKTVANIIK